jgi:hypothetical protein
MAANTTPIFPLVPNFNGGTVTTADATASKNHDGTSSGAVCIFTAGANGARIDEIQALPLGTNVATALRIFINNGSDPTTATNNFLYRDVTAAANTISEVAGITPISILVASQSALVLPAGYRLYAVVGTTIATGLQVTVIGGDY